MDAFVFWALKPASPLSLRLGLFSEEGDFMTYLFDGRRFKVVSRE